MRNRRRHRADITQHNGVVDEDGTPTYDTAEHWTTQIANYPVTMEVASGAVTNRGRQLSAETTTLFKGEYHGGKSITTDMRVDVEGVTYELVTAYDPDGLHKEWWMEAKREE